MAESTPPPLPKAKRLSKGIIWLWSTMGIISIPVLIWGIWLTSLIRHESALRVECVKNHEPIKPADLHTFYQPVKEPENAALGLMKLWSTEDYSFEDRYIRDKASPSPPLDSIPPEFNQPLILLKRNDITEQEWKRLSDYLQTLEERRPRLLAASQKPHCRFPVEFEAGLRSLVPHMSMMRMEADLLTLDALVAVHSNHIARAIEDIKTISAIARLSSEEPSTVGHLVSANICNKGVQSIAYLLSHHQLSTLELKELGQVFAWHSVRSALDMTIKCERANTISIYDLDATQMQDLLAQMSPAHDEVEDRNALRFMLGFARVTGVKQADCICMLDTYRKLANLAKENEPANPTQWERACCQQSENLGFPPKLVSRMMLNPLSSIAYKHWDVAANLQTAKTALAVEMFLIKHGHLPESISDLQSIVSPPDFRDPYGTGDVHFKKLAKGYAVYSVGRDGNDNNGTKPPESGSYYAESDLLFTVTRQE